MLHIPSCACNPQVLYRSDGQFFIHDPGSGHTYPASRGHVLGRFGLPFVECLERDANCWIEFDASDAARVGANRARYEGLGLVEPVGGRHVFVVYDHVKGKAIRAVFLTFKSAILYIDDIDKPDSHWPAIRHSDGSWSVDPAGGSISGAVLQRLHERGERLTDWTPQPMPELRPLTCTVEKLDPALWPEVAALEGKSDATAEGRAA